MAGTTAPEEFDEAFLYSVRPHLVREPGPWQQEAPCAQLPFEEFRRLFFPVRGSRAAASRAKAICAPCTVRLECLGQAIALREGPGIRGGMVLAERRRLTAALGLPSHSRNDAEFLKPHARDAGERG
ncbi:MAG: WhiB family transcriptional regulator [Acidimicrobiales bacterium]